MSLIKMRNRVGALLAFTTEDFVQLLKSTLLAHLLFDIPVAGFQIFKHKNNADALSDFQDVSPLVGVCLVPLFHPGCAHLQVHHHMSTF